MVRVIASDVVPLSACPRRLWYDHNPPAGMDDAADDAFGTLLRELGIAHEQAVLARLADGSGYATAESVEHTRQLVAARAPLIYQPQLVDETEDLFGKPDFLLLQRDGLYQAADAKLAHSIKEEIGIQIAFYRRLLGTPHPGLVFLGTGETGTVADEHDAALDAYIVEARAVLSGAERPEAHYGDSKCSACPYVGVCKPDFVAADALTLLYGVDGRSVAGLNQVGISTIADLASADPAVLPDVPYLKGEKKRRAILQAQASKSGKTIKLGDVALPAGTCVHFDIESNPHTVNGHDHVYLWGFLKPPFDEDAFEYVWTDDVGEDEAGWRGFLAKVAAYRETWPDLKLVHFSGYEVQRIRAYAERYDMQRDPTVSWLLDVQNGPLYDIRKAVVDNLILPLSGYGLKQICKHADLVNFQWENDESGSQWSVVQYVKRTRSADAAERAALKKAILAYNRDDVRATHALEQWLRKLSRSA